MKKFTNEELEMMSYTDIAYEIIKDSKKSKNTLDVFKEVCSILSLSEAQLNNLIADFFASMTTDKRFLLLEEGTWDLRERHASSKVKNGADLEDDEEEEEQEEIEDDDEEEQEDEYDSLDEVNEDDDFEDDDLEDLVVVDEKELGMDE